MSTQNRRSDDRSKLYCDLSKHLVTPGDRAPIRCLAVNVARNGLGIVSYTALAVDSAALFILQNKNVMLKVIWCKPDAAREGVFHVGLKCTDVNVDLTKLMEQAGLVTAGSLTKDTAQQQLSVNVKAITFDVLREAIGNVHTPDQVVLRSTQFAKIAAYYDAYPINHQGVSLFVVLPKATEPAAASKLTSAEAADLNIFILRFERGLLRKVWPAAAAASPAAAS